MQIYNHGGRCCGIKHICGFPYRPSEAVCALMKTVVYQGASPEMAHPAQPFYPGPEPSERGDERLVKLLGYLDKKKGKGHLIEIVLDQWRNAHWEALLKENGFKLVSSFNNQNTHNKLFVYHKVYPKEKEL